MPHADLLGDDAVCRDGVVAQPADVSRSARQRLVGEQRHA
jgi:hypothetical protein